MQALHEAFAAARVLVVGDVILDRYWIGATSRISPEAPVPVVRVQACEERPGGAANVAANVAALGAGATLVGTVGTDEAGATVCRSLDQAGVRNALVSAAGHRTVVKLRVLSQHQQLIRLDFENDAYGIDPDALLARFEAALPECGVVVLSDYAKGTLERARAFIERARAAGRIVVVDPKGAGFGRYRGASVITPNLREFEALVGPCADEARIAERAEGVRAEFDLGALLVTRGERGMTLVARAQPPLHLQARAREVYDVTGAGDTVCAVLAAALAGGCELAHATALANAAAGVVVGKLGAATVSCAEIERALRGDAAGPRIVDAARLLDEVASARRRGQRIVMTNGCFDVLHAGHVACLEAARRLGDRLIVAVNDDASVRRLKGGGRPLVPLAERMEVLAALAAVDWVVAFTEPTPEALIERVLPDVLVKGGDYRPEAIAGAAQVRAHGGEVVVLPYRDGLSTSAFIDAARALPGAGGRS